MLTRTTMAAQSSLCSYTFGEKTPQNPEMPRDCRGMWNQGEYSDSGLISVFTY